MGPRVALLACLITLALAGCGSADREDDAAGVVKRFHAALENRDGQAACAALNEQTASKLESQEQRPCERAILSLEEPLSAEEPARA